jgi:hypothetical protein
MVLSNCTIPHSGQGYVLETTDEPGALTSTSSLDIVLGAVIVGAGVRVGEGVGAGTGCERAIVIALRVSVWKKSPALRPGSAATGLALLGLEKIEQLKEPNKQNTTIKTSEIIRNFFILYLLIVSLAKPGKMIVYGFYPLLCRFVLLGTTFAYFKCYIGIWANQVNIKTD